MPSRMNQQNSLMLDSDPAQAELLLDWICPVLELSCLDNMQAFHLQCAVVEVFNNCIQHAYRGEIGRPIRISYKLHHDRVRISIYDRGRNAFGQPETAVESPMAESGRGLEIIKLSVDRLQYIRNNGWNICRLENWAPPAARPTAA